MADPVDPAPPAPITPIEITAELEDSYLAYAQSVMVSRALPDVRDGLKPSQRRILVAMHDLGLSPAGSTTKCAAIVGETMKRYHPHGDMAIYDTLVRMAQDWVLRGKLIQGQGNFGSVAGLPAADKRYTEAKLAPIAWSMLDDLDKETVDYIDNYDGKYREPLCLPSRYPNLLVNGSDGIAVGMATDIPPHNPTEVFEALIALVDNPNLDMAGVLRIIRGPDFPTGGVIMGRQGMLDGYMGRRGRITLRARCEIIEAVKGKGAVIIIKEVPYQTNRLKLADEIGHLIKDERIKDVSEFRDESSARSGEPVRLVMELKKNADPNLTLNQLYQNSQVQKTISVGMLALVDGRPKFLTLLDMMQEFLSHRVVVIRRRTEYLLREAKKRSHVLEGQLIAIASIDEVIRICRNAPSRAAAKLELMGMEVSAAVMQRAIGDDAFATLQGELGITNIYRMTEAQAEAVVNLRLGQLAALERDEILKEFRDLRGKIREYDIILNNPEVIRRMIRDDLLELRGKFGAPRLTEISDDGGFIESEELIADEPNVVTLSRGGFIKRMPLDTYKVQNRGGKGVQGGNREDDDSAHFLVASTKATLLLFTNFGHMYWLKVWQIPPATRTSPGRAIANVLSLKEGEMVASIVTVRSFAPGFVLLLATRKGLVKKTDLMLYSNIRAGGIIGLNLQDGDTLISAQMARDDDEIMLSTRNGRAIRYSERQVRRVGRNSKGVKGIKLVGDDLLVGMVVADPDGYLLTVCENGYGKRTPFGPNTDNVVVVDVEETDEVPPEEPEVIEAETEEEGEESAASMRYRPQRRGGQGLRDIKTSDRNGKVIAIIGVRDADEIMLISSGGMVTRSKVASIRITGRNTQGVRLMKPPEGDKLVTIAKVPGEAVVVDDTPVESLPLTEPEA